MGKTRACIYLKTAPIVLSHKIAKNVKRGTTPGKCSNYGLFAPKTIRSRERKFQVWNFRSLELSLKQNKKIRFLFEFPRSVTK